MLSLLFAFFDIFLLLLLLFPHLLHKESEKEHFLVFRTRSCRSILKINGFVPQQKRQGDGHEDRGP
jgi:hypothetical protein